jgi:hypothetical protein
MCLYSQLSVESLTLIQEAQVVAGSDCPSTPSVSVVWIYTVSYHLVAAAAAPVIIVAV